MAASQGHVQTEGVIFLTKALMLWASGGLSRLASRLLIMPPPPFIIMSGRLEERARRDDCAYILQIYTADSIYGIYRISIYLLYFLLSLVHDNL